MSGCCCRAVKTLLICWDAALLTMSLHHTSPLSTRATSSLALLKSEAEWISHCRGVGQLATAASTSCPQARAPGQS